MTKQTSEQTPTLARVSEMIRVDHAGEHGAVRIYDGQLAIFDQVPGFEETAKLIRDMAQHEQTHLDHFDQLITTRRVRPTVFGPAWNVAGFALGAVTAMMGEKAAMACTAAVEAEIDAHYGAQLDALEGHEAEADLAAAITQFRADEAEHRQTALDAGAEDAPGYALMTRIIRFGCRAAIRASERY
jgi:ubiquinone biosynthesis monooxygenase Coq7